MFMSSADYRESLRALSPRVFVNGRQVESVADDPDLAPGVAAIGVTYDFALDAEKSVLMRPTEEASGKPVNRLLHINRSPQDLMYKLEAVRLLCQEVGCAQRYLTQDALNAIWQAFSVLLPIQSVGFQGDSRSYERCVALRAVVSKDGMTADWFEFPHDFLKRVSNRITNRVKSVNRVVYDVTSKPPGTIEWE